MAFKKTELQLPEEPKWVINEIPREEYVEPEHPNIKEIPRDQYVPPVKEEEPEVGGYKPNPIGIIPVKKVQKGENTRNGNGHAQVLDVIRKVQKTQTVRESTIGEIAINKVAAKGPEKKYETVFTLNCKTVTKPKQLVEKEDKIENFELYTKKVAKKEKPARKRIEAYEEREDKVGDMYIEKAYRSRVDEVGAKKSR